MAITLDNLKSALTREDSRVFSDGQDMLVSIFCHEGEIVVVTSHLMEDGGYIRCRIPYYLTLQGVEHRGRVLEKLLELNQNLKLLKFCFAPADGEVSVEIDLPVEDGDPTQRQIERCMFVLSSVAMWERDRLRTLMRTGIYPASEDPQFTESLERLFSGSEGPTETSAPEQSDELFDEDLRAAIGDAEDAESEA